MKQIGIRELKTHASEIVRSVKEERLRYVITRHGDPVAVILPVENAPAEGSLQDPERAWDELLQIGEQISRGIKAGQTASQALSEMRR